MPKVSLNPTITQNVMKLKNDMSYYALMGHYKDFKNAKIAYSKIAVDNFELCKNLPNPKVSVPFFSKFGFNIFKIWLMEKFRIETKEEKLFKQMALEEKAKQIVKTSQKNGH